MKNRPMALAVFVPLLLLVVPGLASLCYSSDWNSGASNMTMVPLSKKSDGSTFTSAYNFYKSSPYGYTYFSESNTLLVMLVRDTSGVDSLVLVVDKTSGDDGRIAFTQDVYACDGYACSSADSNPFTSNGMLLDVRDDSGTVRYSASSSLGCTYATASCTGAGNDCYSLEECDGVGSTFYWKWATCCVDGLVLGPMPTDEFCIEYDITSWTQGNGNYKVKLVSQNTAGSAWDEQYFSVSTATDFRVCGTVCEADIPAMCSTAGMEDCVNNYHCGWCSDGEGSCLSDTSDHSSCLDYSQSCTTTCAAIDNCGSCTETSGCGWCGSTGQCLSIKNNGPCEECASFTTFPLCLFPDEYTLADSLVTTEVRDRSVFFTPDLTLASTEDEWDVEDNSDSAQISNWATSSGKITQSGTGVVVDYDEDGVTGTVLVIKDNIDSSNVLLSSEISTTDNEYIGFVMHYVDEDNTYVFEWALNSGATCPGECDHRFRRVKVISGGVTTILYQDDVPYVTGQNYMIELQVHETVLPHDPSTGVTQIDLFIDSEYIWSVGDYASERPSLNPLAGRHGLYNADSSVVTYQNIGFYVPSQVLTAEVDNFRTSSGWSYFTYDASADTGHMVFRVNATFDDPADVSGMELYIREGGYPTSSLYDYQLTSFDTESEFGFSKYFNLNSEGVYYIAVVPTTAVDLNIRIDFPSPSVVSVSDALVDSSQFSWKYYNFTFVSLTYSTLRIVVTPANVDSSDLTIYLSSTVYPFTSIFDSRATTITAEDYYLITLVNPVPGGDYFIAVKLDNDRSNTLSYTISLELPTPSISYVDPSSIGTSGGELIISGIDFGDNGTVLIGSTYPCTVTSWNYDEVICTLDSGAGSDTDVTITRYDGIQSNAFQFSFDAPVITGLSSTSGLTSGGFINTISGSSFGFTGIVTVGSSSICDHTADGGMYSHTSIVCLMPPGSGTTNLVYVTVDSVNSNTKTFAYSPPTLDSLEPANGPTAGGFDITIRGTNFFSGMEASIDSFDCPVVFSNYTTLICTVGENQGVNLPVRVVVDTQSSTNSLEFSYDAPEVYSITPGTGARDASYTVAVSGRNFGVSPSVYIGGVLCSPVSSNSTLITATAPIGGGVNQLVSVIVESLTSSELVYFSYNKPSISTVTPEDGPFPTSGNVHLTLNGADFGTTGTVKVGGVSCPTTGSGYSYANTRIVCKLPAGSGTKSIVVTSSSQVSTGTSFSYDSPTVSSILPTAQSTAGEVAVVIRGTNFGTSAATVAITFGSSACPEILSARTHEYLECYLPAGQGTVNVTVSVSGSSVIAAEYTYGAPSISGITGEGLGTVGGDIITILGSNFGLSGMVTIDGNPCDTGTLSWDHDAVECAIPEGQGTGNVVEISVSGQSDSSTYDYGAPTITAISQTTGSTAYPDPGLTITLTGTNFGDGTGLTLLFDDVEVSAGVTVVNHTSIEFILPEGTGTSKVVSLSVDSQDSTCDIAFTNCAFSYSAPVIDRLEGCTDDTSPFIYDCPVEAGTIITVIGDNFGLALSNDLDSVNVTVGGDDCNVTSIGFDTVDTDMHSIVCSLPGRPAGGYDLDVVVSTVGQSDSEAYLSYAGPGFVSGSLRLCASGSGSTSLTGLDSIGGQAICFQMTDLNDASAEDLSIMVGGSSFPLFDDGLWLSCPVISVANPDVSCSLPVGIGSNLTMLVTVYEQTTPESTDTLSYLPPAFVVDSIRRTFGESGASSYTAESNNGDWLVFDVDNLAISHDESLFDYLSVSLGQPGEDKTISCDQVSVMSNSSVRCKTSKGSGSGYVLELTTLNEVSGESPFFFSYPVPPQIFKVSGCDDVGNTTTNCATAGGTELTVTGQDICDFSEGKNCTVTVKVGLSECSEPTYVDENTFTCTLPAFTGKNLAIRIIEFITGSVFSSTDVFLISYSSASITSVSGCTDVLTTTTECPRGETSDITITGTNFGPSGATVLVGGLECANLTHSSVSPHTSVSCTAPGGTTENVDVILIQSSGAVSDIASLSYLQCVAGHYSTPNSEDEVTCSPCAAGKFNVAAGSTTCVDCESGKISSEDGASECTQCSAGTSSEAGQSECTNCTSGYYSASDGSASCTLCPVGRFAGSVQAVTCSRCLAGTFGSTAGLSECPSCPRGEYSLTLGAVSCSPCEAGSYNNDTGATGCMACDSGTYSASSGAELCDSCPIGKANELFGRTGCSPCDGGYFSNETGTNECLECEPGYFSLVTSDQSGVDSCTACPSGSYINVGAYSRCLQCPQGTFSSSDGASDCTNCPAGEYTNTIGSESCDMCLAGKYTPSPGALSCISCDIGKFSDEDRADACVSCPAGKHQPSPGSSQCNNCSIGEAVGVSGQASCISCEPGYVALTEGATACEACAAGYFSEFEDTDCTICPAGRYSGAVGSVGCTVCPVGRYSSADGQSSCTACLPGTFTEDLESISCTNCTSGTYAAGSGSYYCEVCESGTHAPEDAAVICDNCGAGFYQDDISASDCKSCLAGSYTSAERQSTCISCAVGYIAAFDEAVECSICTAGSFQPDIASDTCQDCSAGSITALDGQITCVNCAAGFYSESDGDSVCTPCSAGYFSSAGSTECTPCSVGTYSVADGQSKCQECTSGYYSDTTNATTCEACPSGEFSEFYKSGGCTQCLSGFYTQDVGSSECIPCAVGFFADSLGTDECSECPEGTFQDATSSVDCQECEVGRFSNSTAVIACELCEPGSFAGEEGALSCQECSIGKYQDSFGQLQCLDCPTGTASNLLGVKQCEDCEKGYFANSEGKYSCDECLPGNYADTRGSDSCKGCEAGKYNEEYHQTTCLFCSRGTFTNTTGQVNCTECPAGSFTDASGLTVCELCETGRSVSEPGQDSCSRCDRGRFAEFPGQSTCPKCAKGSAQANQGQSTCPLCYQGYFADSEGLLECEPCAAGTFTSLEGEETCTQCEPGTYQGSSAATLCFDCDVGYAAVSTKSLECTICSAGEFANLTGTSVCSSCAAGRYQEEEGKSACLNCQPGFYSGSRSAQCTQCDKDTVAPFTSMTSCLACPENGQAAEDFTKCVCAIGYYANSTEEDEKVYCEVCPVGAVCDTPGVTWETLETEEGYWRSSDSAFTFYQCAFDAYCTGGRSSGCADHREGPLCAICEEGYSELGNECKECGSQAKSVATMVIMCIFIALIIFFMYYVLLKWDKVAMRKMKKMQIANAIDQADVYDADDLIETIDLSTDGTPNREPNFVYKMKIVLGFFQISVGIAFALTIPWPSLFKEFISLFNIANFDILQWTRADCLVRVSFLTKHLIVAMTPIVLFAIICSVYLLPKWIRKTLTVWSSDAARAELAKLKFNRGMRKFWKMFFFTIFLIYPSVSSIVVRLYDCRLIEGTWYLWSDFTITCTSDEWLERAFLNILFVFIYPIGILALFFCLLFFNRHNLEKPSFVVQFGFLYGAFSYSNWWFEPIDMAHKLVLTSLLTFFPTGYQLPVALTVITIHHCILLSVKPYTRKGDDRLHQLVQVELYSMVSIALYFNF